MDRCPLCRARLNGADTCRRCRAELGSAQQAEREGQALLDAAIYSLALDDVEAADQLLRRALAVHATLEVRALSQLVAKPARPPGGGDERGSEAN
jgi:hypothetical protein